MADYPCDMHGARYAGLSTRMYLNVFTEDRSASFRFSLCPTCLTEVLDAWLGKALHQTGEGYWDPPVDGEALEDLLVRPSGPARRSYRR